MSTPATIPDLSDFKPDTADLSDFKPDRAVMSASTGPMPAGSPGLQYSRGGGGTGDDQRKFSGGFIDRATSYLGENLSGMMQHPLDTLKGMLQPLAVMDSTGIARGLAQGRGPTSSVAPMIQRYANDPAAAAGDAATAAMMSTVGGKPPGINLAEASAGGTVPEGMAHPMAAIRRGAAAMEPNLAQLIKKPITTAVMAAPNAVKAALGNDIQVYPVDRPAPAWQTNPQPIQEIGYRGSTPDEIQAQLQRMAARASKSRPVGAPSDTPQVQTIPVQSVKPTQPPFPGPQTYDVTRGADPFTHPNAPSNWRFDQDYSTNVKQYGYHPDSQTLSVQYKKGAVYQFKATQQQFNEMQKAPSAGGYLHDVIEPSQTRGVGQHIGTVQPKATPGQKVSQALGGQQ